MLCVYDVMREKIDERERILLEGDEMGILGWRSYVMLCYVELNEWVFDLFEQNFIG